MADRLERTWDGRVNSWHHHVTDSPKHEAARGEVFRIAQPQLTDECADLGAGTGFLTLPLAKRVGRVIAIDISPAMMQELAKLADDQGLSNVEMMTGDLIGLAMPEQSLDVVVSSYVLHHLPHPQKREVVAQAYRWLRPGGRLVVSDMMFGRSLSPNDRQVLAAKAKMFAKMGPGGVWRIAKNVARMGFGVGQERPAPPEFWMKAFEDAGFNDVASHKIVQEAWIVSGRR
jgi:ubiquinone/menaquinone biosynthesis C-methylase UbiE